MSTDIAERVAAVKKQVESLKKQVTEARADKRKDYVGIASMGNVDVLCIAPYTYCLRPS